MSDLDREIRNRIDAFVSELEQLVREAALESVAEALGAAGGRRPAAARRPGVAIRPGQIRAPGAKRSAHELESLKGDVLSYIQQNPGRGVERMAQDLGTTTRELNLPIKKLVSEKAINTKGHKRATKYFPGGGGGGGAPARARRKAGRRRRKK